MSTPRGPAPLRNADETLSGLLDGVVRLLLGIGLLAMVGAGGLLIYYFINFNSGTAPAGVAEALGNVESFKKVLFAGTVAVAIATAYQFWGEEILGPIQLMASAVLYLAPLWLPMVSQPSGEISQVSATAAAAIQSAGGLFGTIAILVTMADVTARVRERMKYGAKAEQLKYGKAVKAEKINNVFLGKCYQLPFCREFVRQRCPIYHAKRACWRERVGCMCDEQIINSAMQGTATMPKDALAAAQYIPKNTRLTESQKAERCRQCVIYNEHQRQKYKAALPAMLLFVVLLYVLGKGFLMGMLQSVLVGADNVISKATFKSSGVASAVGDSSMTWLREVLLIGLLLVLLAYMLKLVEFLIFKLKI